MIQTLLLAKSKKEWLYLFIIFSIIFILNIAYIFNQYKNIISNDIYTSDVKIINIYKKDNYNVLKLENNNLIFFTSTKRFDLEKNDLINITFVTNNINFLEYMKGFFTNSFNIHVYKNDENIFTQYIQNQHNNQSIAQIFTAIFLGIPLDKSLQIQISTLGISHLIAISGFHIGILTFIIYFLLSKLYSKFHSNYFPYRNIKFDLLIITSIFIFIYMIYLGTMASLLRAFVMYIFAFIFLRANIKLFSFTTLLLVTIFILSLFPKLIFSLSLWFSISGVFYIYLFIQYFKKLNKVLAFLLFNVWIYLAMNPITHYFFDITSLLQLFSPVLSLIFSIFYPLELFLHLISYGDLFDDYINYLINLNSDISYYKTSYVTFMSYLLVSLLSIKYKVFFILLNIFFIVFNLNLYLV
jgi:competence protein ComEC